MNDLRTIVIIGDYGKVHLRLKELMDKRKITRYHLAECTKTRFEVIAKWYNDDVEKLDLDVLARICHALECSVGDLLYYEEK